MVVATSLEWLWKHAGSCKEGFEIVEPRSKHLVFSQSPQLNSESKQPFGIEATPTSDSVFGFPCLITWLVCGSWQSQGLNLTPCK